jgi:hypothetical protein
LFVGHSDPLAASVALSFARRNRVGGPPVDDSYGSLPYLTIDPPRRFAVHLRCGLHCEVSYVTDDESTRAIQAAGDSHYS